MLVILLDIMIDVLAYRAHQADVSMRISAFKRTAWNELLCIHQRFAPMQHDVQVLTSELLHG